MDLRELGDKVLYTLESARGCASGSWIQFDEIIQLMSLYFNYFRIRLKLHRLDPRHLRRLLTHPHHP